MPYRLIYIGLALIAVAAIALALAFNPQGSAVELPDQVESVSPRPGDMAIAQATLEIDMLPNYRLEIYVNDWPITDATFVEATGVYRWSPSPSHPSIQSWNTGTNTVRIVWDTASGLPDPGTFTWTFQVR